MLKDIAVLFAALLICAGMLTSKGFQMTSYYWYTSISLLTVCQLL